MAAALKGLGRQVRIPEDRIFIERQPIEYAVLRSTGIPGLGTLRGNPYGPFVSRVSWRFPYAAFQAKGRVFAYAYLAPRAGGQQAGDRAIKDRPLGAQVQVWDVASRSVLWHARIPSEYRPERVPKSMLTNPPTGPWTWVEVRDPRWSTDGRYFLFTMVQERDSSVVVLNTSDWAEVRQMPDAANGFVIPN
jgi:hypothetical protein